MRFPSHRLQEGYDGYPLGTGDSIPTVRSADHVLVAMTLEQARAALQALDLFNRLGLGQIEELAQLVNTGMVPVFKKPQQPRETASMEVADEVYVKMKLIKSMLGYPSGGSLGVGHPHVAVDAMRAYELQKVIAQAIATRPGSITPQCSVDRDGLGPRYTPDQAPEAVWVQAPK